MRTRKAHYAAILAVGALALSACSAGGGGGSGTSGNGPTATVQNFGLGTAADSQGPATPVSGAKTGGTVTDLEPTGIDYLDPGQVYVSNELAIAQLYNRSLTGYKIDPKTGKTILVGDLATDTGEPSAGDKTWTYHLKDNLKFQDGTPITSQDIKYGIERLYANFETQGPTYIPTWLDGVNYRNVYSGPYGGKSLPDSAIATPDSKTIIFHFQAPHADAPYAMAMPNVSPIPASKDDKQSYNNHPVSSGPYQIQSYQPGKQLVLTRNKYWDPKTDPIRNAYPDEWNLQLGIANPGLTQRLMAESGTDKDALALSQPADASQMSTLVSGSQYPSRTVSAYQPYVEVINLNANVIKDERVRQAIAYALPLTGIQQAMGGAAQGDLGTNLLSPTIGGFKPFDPYNKLKQPQGDPAKAKQLLQQAGVHNLTLSFAYANTPRWQEVSLIIQKALANAGINVQRIPLDPTSYYTLVGKANNQYAMYRTGWGADWPVGSTVIPPSFDGRTIGDGSPNYSHLNDPYVNSQIDAINKITDVNQADAQWEKLSEYILTHDTTQIPFLYDKFYQVYGDGLGGVTYNQVIGTINPGTVYVK
ncbi:ABC transporter substrate-binding protein [Streptomyces sp. RB6PN25]|uniref:ABC transporter substrate-binding protein n=1 Tax=Streptomyces humicola TaxID=2953240 RepID=A0ABT1PR80_9ACTN|nr:ABC transporter substrate-binding protein [Streptomyces humicola]MCQ4080178.1 ABC transporter substrate-binding protein [Streptomyces humicola]